ncbi:MAG: ArsA family ATPase [candidate division NC10 bacterium]|nr:ArsA family ATPase [candidate division NC10 bacterium]
MPKAIFFLGKGGVGKTTCAAHAALALADGGRRVLVVSLDPAHNLGDVLDLPLRDRPVQVAPRLEAMEVDVEGRIRRYLHRAADRFQGVYRYLRVFNVDRSLDLLRYAPGVEEEAILDALRELLLAGGGDGYEVVVVDTPPTGLTLRVLGLPRVSLLWLDRLIGLRARILDLRGMVAHVQGERVFQVEGERLALPHRAADDPVLAELHRVWEETKALEGLLTDVGQTAVAVVLTPESLPLLETLRTLGALERFGMPASTLIVNKVWTGQGTPAPDPLVAAQQAEILGRLRRQVGLPVLEAALEPTEVRGLQRLRAFTCPAGRHFAAWVSGEAVR